MQINWNRRKHLHKKRVQLPLDWFGKPTDGRCFIVLEHQYGRHDVISKRFIVASQSYSLTSKCNSRVLQIRERLLGRDLTSSCLFQFAVVVVVLFSLSFLLLILKHKLDTAESFNFLVFSGKVGTDIFYRRRVKPSSYYF